MPYNLFLLLIKKKIKLSSFIFPQNTLTMNLMNDTRKVSLFDKVESSDLPYQSKENHSQYVNGPRKVKILANVP